jgi:periplasmic divalent cation tolerance protein
MTSQKIVVTTTGSQDEARRIADALVERRLAACVNIIPAIESVYRWQGKIERAQECLLLIETEGTAAQRVRQAVSELHSYDLPECIELTIDDGNPAYLKWITDSVQV